MSRSSLLLSPRAADDLEDLWSYVADSTSDDIADGRMDRIFEACSMLRDQPRSGRPRDELAPGLRSVAVPPWVVFYRIRADTLEVVRVLHGRRDLPSIL